MKRFIGSRRSLQHRALISITHSGRKVIGRLQKGKDVSKRWEENMRFGFEIRGHYSFSVVPLILQQVGKKAEKNLASKKDPPAIRLDAHCAPLMRSVYGWTVPCSQMGAI
ncbi:hypothetical protein CDAR_396721 [Caerostris darwini]|uniref:Ribosomal protein L16 n=1 Tax=Caerostris darwini TaxID=1538125 RepID=A0AAV4PQS0_9ARAC|nr:hypothetical protein CDAR_396721 [Caerostris darwini]